MEFSQNQIVPKRKTFWRMVRTMFVPARNIAKLMVGCGGKGGKAKRRLTLRNMQQAKDAFMRASLQGAAHLSDNQRIHSEPRNRNFARSSTDDHTSARIEGNDSTNDILVSLYSPSETVNPGQQQSIQLTGTNASLSSSIPILSAPAPVNLQEAELLLESLTLCSQSQTVNSDNYTTQHDSDTAVRTENVQVVETEILTNDSSQNNVDHSTPFANVETFIDGDDNESDRSTRLVGQQCTHDVENDSRSNTRNVVNSRTTSLTSINSIEVSAYQDDNAPVVLRRSRTTASFSSTVSGNEYNGWRKSSIEVTSNPPITLAFIPSGLCVGDRVVWVKDEHPEIGTVRWIGKIRQEFYAGIEFDKPVGNSSGIYGYGIGMYKRLFTCQLAYGRFVPVKELVLYKDYHDTGVKSGIVCVICRDDFLDSWEPDMFQQQEETACGDELQPFHMVSTKCGHLYHWGCLDQWFSSKKRSEFNCPFCSRSMNRNDVIRIFPAQV